MKNTKADTEVLQRGYGGRYLAPEEWIQRHEAIEIRTARTSFGMPAGKMPQPFSRETGALFCELGVEESLHTNCANDSVIFLAPQLHRSGIDFGLLSHLPVSALNILKTESQPQSDPNGRPPS